MDELIITRKILKTIRENSNKKTKRKISSMKKRMKRITFA